MNFRLFNSISLYTGRSLSGSSSQSPGHCSLTELCLNSFSRSLYSTSALLERDQCYTGLTPSSRMALVCVSHGNRGVWGSGVCRSLLSAQSHEANPEPDEGHGFYPLCLKSSLRTQLLCSLHPCSHGGLDQKGLSNKIHRKDEKVGVSISPFIFTEASFFPCAGQEKVQAWKPFCYNCLMYTWKKALENKFCPIDFGAWRKVQLQENYLQVSM